MILQQEIDWAQTASIGEFQGESQTDTNSKCVLNLLGITKNLDKPQDYSVE